MGASCVTVSGGEPLLHPDFFAFLEQCSKLDFKVRIYSSGVLMEGDRFVSINNYIVNNISAFNNVEAVIFSLHGSNSITHDYITDTVGSFDLTLESIKRVSAARINIEIHIVPMSINYKEIPELIQLATHLNVEQISLLRLVPQGRYHQNEHLLMNANETREFVKIVGNCLLKNIRKGAPFKCLFLDSEVNCNAGKDKVLIGSDGSVFPCEAFKAKKSDSNIKMNSLKQIWRHDSLINQVRYLRIADISFCNKCHEMHTCSGGCPGQRLLYNNNLLIGPDPLCINN